MSQPDNFLTNAGVSKNLSGDDDLEDLEQNGKGLVVSNDGSNEERPTWSSNRYYCTNCRKGIHNTPDNDRRCKRKGCECRCLTHYIGRDGRPRPYGVPDDSFTKQPKPKPKTKAQLEADAALAKMMDDYLKKKPAKPQQAEKPRVL